LGKIYIPNLIKFGPKFGTIFSPIFNSRKYNNARRNYLKVLTDILSFWSLLRTISGRTALPTFSLLWCSNLCLLRCLAKLSFIFHFKSLRILLQQLE
jgi:hypothetical protein